MLNLCWPRSWAPIVNIVLILIENCQNLWGQITETEFICSHNWNYRKNEQTEFFFLHSKPNNAEIIFYEMWISKYLVNGYFYMIYWEELNTVNLVAHNRSAMWTSVANNEQQNSVPFLSFCAIWPFIEPYCCYFILNMLECKEWGSAADQFSSLYIYVLNRVIRIESYKKNSSIVS